jgi:hypothetical protein
MAAESNPQNDTGKEAADALSALQVSRRRLLRNGVGATPALLTFVSPTVLAGGSGICTPPSSFASLNASRPSHTYTCTGHKPAYWKDPSCYSKWPKGCTPKSVTTSSGATQPATKFNDVFGSTRGFPGKSLLDVLSFADESGHNGLAKYCTAAYLNAVNGDTPDAALGVAAVKRIWSEYVGKTYFEPSAGIRWYPDSSVPTPSSGGMYGITAYLKSTMPL